MAATIKDIAKETGLGLATISSYLNGGNVREKNRIKIEKAIEELDYEVNEMARGLKTNKSKIIGVVIPELNNVFITEIISIVEDIFRKEGYATLVCDCRTDPKIEKEVVEFLYKKRVDGIINMPVTPDGAHLKLFVDSNKPILLLDRKVDNMDSDLVLIDNRQATKNASDLLIKNGHKKIGFIAGPKNVYTSIERMAGYKTSLLEAGIDFDDNLIAYGDYTINGGAKSLKKLVKDNPDLTAVIASNAEMTIGTFIGIGELGLRVPEEISVIGFDNLEFARAMNPKVTIVTQPIEEIANVAARIMLNQLEASKGKRKDKKTPNKVKVKDNKEERQYETVKLTTEIIPGNSIKNIS